MYFRMILFSYTCIVSILEFVVAVQADTKPTLNNNELSLSLSNEQVTEYNYEKTIQSTTTENNQDISITTNINTEFAQEIHSSNELDLNVADSSDLNSELNIDIMSDMNMLNNNEASITNDYGTQMSTLEISNTEVKIEGDTTFVSPNGVKDSPNYNNPTNIIEDLTDKQNGQDYDSNGNKISDTSVMNSYQTSSYYGYNFQNIADVNGDIPTTAPSSPDSKSSPSSSTPTSSNGNLNSGPNSKQNAATPPTPTSTTNSNGSPSSSSPKSPTGDSTGKPNGQYYYDSYGNKILDLNVADSSDLNSELNIDIMSDMNMLNNNEASITNDYGTQMSTLEISNTEVKIEGDTTFVSPNGVKDSPNYNNPTNIIEDLTDKQNGQDYDSNGNKISDTSVMNSYQSSSYYGYNFQNIADVNGDIPTTAPSSPDSKSSPSSSTPTSSNGNLNSGPNSKQNAATPPTPTSITNSNGSPSSSSPKSPTGDSTGKPNGQSSPSSSTPTSANGNLNSGPNSKQNAAAPSTPTSTSNSNGSPYSSSPKSPTGDSTGKPNGQYYYDSYGNKILDLNVADSSDLNSELNIDIMSDMNMLNNNEASITNDYGTQMSTLEISNTEVKIEGDTTFVSPNGVKDSPNYNNPTNIIEDLTDKQNGQDYDSNGNKISDTSVMNSYQTSSYYGYNFQNIADVNGDIPTTAPSSPDSKSSPSSSTPTSSNGNLNSGPNSKQNAATPPTPTSTTNSNGSPSSSSPKSPTGDSTGKPNGQYYYDSYGNKILDLNVADSSDLNSELNIDIMSDMNMLNNNEASITNDYGTQMSTLEISNTEVKIEGDTTFVSPNGVKDSPNYNNPTNIIEDLTDKQNGQDYDSNGNKISDTSVMNSYQSSSYYGYNFQNIADVNGDIPTTAPSSPDSKSSPSSSTPTSSNGNLNSGPNSKQNAATPPTPTSITNSNGSPSSSSPKSPTGDSTGKPNGQSSPSSSTPTSANGNLNSGPNSKQNAAAPSTPTSTSNSNGSPYSSSPKSPTGDSTGKPNGQYYYDSYGNKILDLNVADSSDLNSELNIDIMSDMNMLNNNEASITNDYGTQMSTLEISNTEVKIEGDTTFVSPNGVKNSPNLTDKQNGQDYDSNGNKISDTSVMNSYQSSSYYGYNFQNIADVNGDIPTPAPSSPGSGLTYPIGVPINMNAGIPNYPQTASPNSVNGTPNSKINGGTTSTTTSTSNLNGSPSSSSPKSPTGDSTGKPNGQSSPSSSTPTSSNGNLNSGSNSEENAATPSTPTSTSNSNVSPSSSSPKSPTGDSTGKPNGQSSPSSSTPTSSNGNLNSGSNSKQNAATPSTTTSTSNSNGSPSSSSPKSPTGDSTGIPSGQGYDSNGNMISDTSIVNSYQSSSSYGYNFQNIADINGDIPIPAPSSPGSVLTYPIGVPINMNAGIPNYPQTASPNSGNGTPNSKINGGTTSTTTSTSNSNVSPSSSSPKSPTGDSTGKPNGQSSPSSSTPTSSNGNLNSGSNSKQNAATPSTPTSTSNSNGYPSSSSPKSPTGDSTGIPSGQGYGSNGNMISDTSIVNSYQSSSSYGYNFQNIADINGDIPIPAPSSLGSVLTYPIGVPINMNAGIPNYPQTASPNSGNGTPNSKINGGTTSTTTSTSNSNVSPSSSSPKSPTGDSTGKPNGQSSPSSSTPTSSNGNLNSGSNSKQNAATPSTPTSTSNSNGSPSSSSPKSPTGDSTGIPSGQGYDSNGNMISDTSIVNSYQSSSSYGYNFQNIADINGDIPIPAPSSPGSVLTYPIGVPINMNAGIPNYPQTASPNSGNGTPNSKINGGTTSTTTSSSNSNVSPSSSSPKSPTGDSTGKPNGQSSPSSSTPTSSNGNLNSGSNSKQNAATPSTPTSTSNSNGSPSSSSPKSPTGDSTGIPSGQGYDSNGNMISDTSIVNSYQSSSSYGYNFQNIADINGDIPIPAPSSPGSVLTYPIGVPINMNAGIPNYPQTASPNSGNGTPNSKINGGTTSTTTSTSNSNVSPSSSSPKSPTGDSTGKPNGQSSPSSSSPTSSNGNLNSGSNSKQNAVTPSTPTSTSNSNGSPSSSSPKSPTGDSTGKPNGQSSPSSSTPTSSNGNSNSGPNSKQNAATPSTPTSTSNSNGSPSISSPKSLTGDSTEKSNGDTVFMWTRGVKDFPNYNNPTTIIEDLTDKQNGQDYDSNGNKISDNSFINSYQTSNYYGYIQNIADQDTSYNYPPEMSEYLNNQLLQNSVSTFNLQNTATSDQFGIIPSSSVTIQNGNSKDSPIGGDTGLNYPTDMNGSPFTVDQTLTGTEYSSFGSETYGSSNYDIDNELRNMDVVEVLNDDQLNMDDRYISDIYDDVNNDGVNIPLLNENGEAYNNYFYADNSVNTVQSLNGNFDTQNDGNYVDDFFGNVPFDDGNMQEPSYEPYAPNLNARYENSQLQYGLIQNPPPFRGSPYMGNDIAPFDTNIYPDISSQMSVMNSDLYNYNNIDGIEISQTTDSFIDTDLTSENLIYGFVDADNRDLETIDSNYIGQVNENNVYNGQGFNGYNNMQSMNVPEYNTFNGDYATTYLSNLGTFETSSSNTGTDAVVDSPEGPYLTPQLLNSKYDLPTSSDLNKQTSDSNSLLIDNVQFNGYLYRKTDTSNINTQVEGSAADNSNGSPMNDVDNRFKSIQTTVLSKNNELDFGQNVYGANGQVIGIIYKPSGLVKTKNSHKYSGSSSYSSPNDSEFSDDMHAIGQDVKRAARDAIGHLHDNIKDAYDTTKAVGKALGNIAGDAASKAADGIEQTAETAYQGSKDAVKKVGNAVGDAVDDLEETEETE